MRVVTSIPKHSKFGRRLKSIMLNRQTRILVTGGHGFLGSCVVETLGSREYAHIVAPSKLEYDLRSQVQSTRLLKICQHRHCVCMSQGHARPIP